MPDKNEIERRKQIKKELREKARLEFEKSLPISRKIFQELFDFIDERLSENGCDDTLRITKEFLKEHNIQNIEDIEEWLQENGSYCDCEIIYNVEEMFNNDSIL